MILQRVTKLFKRPGGLAIRAVKEVDLRVEDRQCLALVGPSGSGKTTILRLIAGLERLNFGTISIGGAVVNDLPAHARDVAMVFQNPALYPHMSAYENLAFGLRLRSCPRQELDRKVRQAAEILGLTPFLAALPAELSGGERQRVAIGRAIVRQAGLLLLDEPLANVDPSLRATLRDDISNLRTRFGTTIIYVTHDHFEAMLMGDRIAVLHDGIVEQCAEPRTLYRAPVNLFVARFIGSPSINLFEGVLLQRAGQVLFQVRSTQTAGGESRPEEILFPLGGGWRAAAESCAGRPMILGLRPEQIFVANQIAGPKSQGILASICAARNAGPDDLVTATTGQIRFVARIPAERKLVPGQKHLFGFMTELACLFDPVSGLATKIE